MSSPQLTSQKIQCYHCGEPCPTGKIMIGEKKFCCEGCKMVFEILNQGDLCDYYNLNQHPGITRRVKLRKDKFAFLDNEKIQAQLTRFRNDNQTHTSFYLPQIHCSSCLYLLENLHRLDPAIISSKVDFLRKEVDIVFQHDKITFRKLVEILTSIGYEPYLSLNDLKEKRPSSNKRLVSQLGVAGFCFGNIMLMSFPEYLGIDASEAGLRNTFRWLNLGLAVPVLFYSAEPFFTSSWKSLRHKFLNIDTPIALAILITFIRSAYEVISGTGGGYFDSMAGIVFFMLAGRLLQDKTYRQLSFERDYTSYFPIAVSVLKQEKEVPTLLPDIKPGDTLFIHHEELLPADGILTKGKALIDYSFVTGETLPVVKEVGELVYAGGRQTGGNIETLVIKEVSQSYLTSLWNRDEFKKQPEKHISFVHLLSRYFTYIVLAIALATAVYWQLNDSVRLWPAVTSIFIIACPCALLLSNSFTNGNILRVLGRNNFYLRNAQAIENIAKTTHIVFDKTGTLTSTLQQHFTYNGTKLSGYQLQQAAALASCSSHPLSKALAAQVKRKRNIQVVGFKETPGEGIEGFVNEDLFRLGSFRFVTGKMNRQEGTAIFLSIENKTKGFFQFENHYRANIPGLVQHLKTKYDLTVLSGDNENEKQHLRELFGEHAILRFHQNPEDKLRFIRQLQQQGDHVMMIGDGLNDAGALKQSDIGIAVTEQTNNFTPASDAILSANKLFLLDKFIHLCKANHQIVIASFALSILYNIIGLFFAVQGNLSPLVAAILMPCSSLSILLLTFGSSNYLARRLGL